MDIEFSDRTRRVLRELEGQHSALKFFWLAQDASGKWFVYGGTSDTPPICRKNQWLHFVPTSVAKYVFFSNEREAAQHWTTSLVRLV